MTKKARKAVKPKPSTCTVDIGFDDFEAALRFGASLEKLGAQDVRMTLISPDGVRTNFCGGDADVG